MPLHSLSEVELRLHCRSAIEALELWLRRLIDETLSEAYGPDYLNAQTSNGDYLAKRETREKISGRFASAPSRYSRPIDAALLEEEIDIICNPQLYNSHFSSALKVAFPDGREEARTFLKPILNSLTALLSIRSLQHKVLWSLIGM